jgi:plasmid stabilization system protein ParE
MKVLQNDIPKYKVKMTKGAEDDLADIVSFIAENNAMNSIEIYHRIKKRALGLDTFPGRGEYVPELLAKNIKEYRQIKEKPWRIIYKADDGKLIVHILAIIDSRRNVQDILMEKLMRKG